MRINQKKHGGFSFVELLIGILLAIPLIYLFSSALTSVFRSRDSLIRTGDMESTLVRLHNHLLENGRLSTGCAVLAAPSVGLRCTIDRSAAAVPVPLNVRWILQGGEVLFQTEQAPINSNIYVTDIKYTHVNMFQICDDAMIIAGTCPILPQAMSKARRRAVTYCLDPQHANFPICLCQVPANQNLPLCVGPVRLTAPNIVGRFFRFFIQTRVEARPNQNENETSLLSLQGNFFSRNIGGATANVSYVWGGRD